MSTMRATEIDFDVHKKIEAERQSFEETDNDVLRRLLNISEHRPKAIIPRTEKRPWTKRRVTLPHGTELRMEYNGRQYTGEIADGRWIVDGRAYTTPSAAARGVAVTKDGRHTNLDGWRYWHVKRPGDVEWTRIGKLLNMMIRNQSLDAVPARN